MNTMKPDLTDRLRASNGDDCTLRIDAADLIENVYGLLWRDTATLAGSPTSEARKLLLSAMSKDGQRRGISFAGEQFGPVSDAEALRNFP